MPESTTATPSWPACSMDGGLGVSVVWLLVIALAVAKLRQADGVIVALAGLAASAVTFGLLATTDRLRWRNPDQGYNKYAPPVEGKPPDTSAGRSRSRARAGRS